MKNVTFSAQRVNQFSTCARCGAEDHAESLHEGLCAGCAAEVRRSMIQHAEYVSKINDGLATLLSACEAVVEAVRGPMPVDPKNIASLLQGAIDLVKVVKS